MKTVITKSLVNNLQRAHTTPNSNGVFVPIPLIASDYVNFNNEIPSYKQEAYDWFRKTLPRGGFSFDPSLWRWYTTGDAYKLSLWVEITWTDDDNVGKAQFMQYMKQTRIFDYNSQIIKPYS